MRDVCEKCVTDKSFCDRCCDAPKYRDYPRQSFFSEYVPTCHLGYSDCICDPAYIQHYNPDWYKEMYADVSPAEASGLTCRNCTEENCMYDDEDK